MTAGGFTGLCQEGIDFLAALHWNNNKPFFEENRGLYDRCLKQPLEALAQDLAPAMTTIDRRLDVRPARVVARIYRDARYSHGIPYRDYLWLSWKAPDRTNSNAFTYYFFVDIRQCGWGMGFYQPEPSILQAFRQKLLAQSQIFEQIVSAEGVRAFTLVGEDYRRPPQGTEPPVELRQWYMKKTFYLEHTEPVAASFDPALAQRIAGDFMDLAPLYRFVVGEEPDHE